MYPAALLDFLCSCFPHIGILDNIFPLLLLHNAKYTYKIDILCQYYQLPQLLNNKLLISLLNLFNPRIFAFHPDTNLFLYSLESKSLTKVNNISLLSCEFVYSAFSSDFQPKNYFSCFVPLLTYSINRTSTHRYIH